MSKSESEKDLYLEVSESIKSNKAIFNSVQKELKKGNSFLKVLKSNLFIKAKVRNLILKRQKV